MISETKSKNICYEFLEKRYFSIIFLIYFLNVNFVSSSVKPCPAPQLVIPCKCEHMLSDKYIFRELKCFNNKNLDFGKYFENLEKVLEKEGDKTFFRIEIRYTDIELITENIFSNIEFEIVVINDNDYLTSIDPKAFINDTAKSIKNFYAQMNNFSSEDIFLSLKSLESVETIDLYGNEIENIPSNAFEGF